MGSRPFFREALISRKWLGCNGLGPADLPGKPLAKLVAPLAPDTQGKGWELGRGKEGPWPLLPRSRLSPCFHLSVSFFLLLCVCSNPSI